MKIKTFNKSIIYWIVLLTMSTQLLTAQAEFASQTVRGKVLDKESQMPIIGANITIEKTIPLMGSSTDEDGQFKINEVPLGRQTFIITYLGYEPQIIPNLLITSGKEIVLNVEISESPIQMEEVVVKASDQKNQPINEMALVSARTFSVEETSRFAASLYDPARMAQNYAGVSFVGGSSDLFNEIIVRGNSPKGVMWRLEGIEIPNPNHFGELGNSGGGISMLSSSMLTNSDFYTGAFPAEFGNATSGVFDLNLRKGNNEKREYSLMLGVLGIEGAAEGPIGQKGGASYLANFRYSTLSVLEKIGLSPVSDALPEYGDLAFNFSFPKTGFGQVNIFGLMGKNRSYFAPEPDSTKWEFRDDNEGYDGRQDTKTLGLVHKFLLGDNAYLKTVFAYSSELYDYENYLLDTENNYKKETDFVNRFETNTLRLSTSYTHKLNARNTYKLGAIASQSNYQLGAQERDLEENIWTSFLDNKGTARQLQGYGQWKHRPTEKLTLTGGFHLNYSEINKQLSVEPRIASKLQLNGNQSISFAAGIHSRPEHPAFHLVETIIGNEIRENPNRDLKMGRSLHTVIGYERPFGQYFNFKIEAYFQYLFDVPVEKDSNEISSLLNAIEIWDVINAGPAVSEGVGKNYGVDITIEKYFSQQYYFMITASVFESKFRTIAGKWYDTRFNSKYQFNLLGGKEWKIGKNKQNTFGVNGKFLINGGERSTPINFSQSEIEGYTIRNEDQFLGESLGKYYRFDVGLSYQINRKNITHTLRLDVQNVSSRLNPYANYYHQESNSIQYDSHTGLFPVLNYRIEF